uniref:Uncharacterized protein n=1 Tax=Tanacetum cinerariifolium TaxID=118510 RepID=A0A6L2P4G5_TANCI|nr:hypothetical protein [Tanacetum cinerariifolium]
MQEDQGYVDCGCFRHMTENMSYLFDFKELDGGYVTFGGGANVVKITSKGTLKIGKLDFEDVYFVKELKFSLLNVSQMALVVKPHNKTPYELFRGRTHALSFVRPFGCHVTILNTLDHLGKFDGKAYEGYFIRYSMNSKAFRVYNIRTRRVEKDLHIEFLENKPIVAGTKDCIGAGHSSMETGSTQDYIFIPFWKDGSPLFDSSLKISGDDGKKHDEVSDNESGTSNKLNFAFENLNNEYPDDPKMPGRATQFKLKKVWILVDLPKGKKAIGTKWVFMNKKDNRGIVIKNIARLVAQGHTQEEGIDYDQVFAPVARNEAIRLLLAYASFMGVMVYQMDMKSTFLYGRIEEEVYVCQPLGFEDPGHPNKVYVDDIIFGSTKKELCTEFERLMKDKFQMSSMGELTFFLGLKVKQKEDGIFISQYKYVTKVLRKFNFSDVKSASTPVDIKKTLVKDADGDDVDVHLYRFMIGSLMYLTSSRLDIMYVVCVCAIFQVTLKVSHLHAVKRIFRYLKGHPKLGLWYPRDFLFELVAFTDSDYARASLDRKSTTGGCQFLGSRLISWQCKKQTVVATSTTEADYAATASCCGKFWQTATASTLDNGEMEITTTIDGKVKVVIKASVRIHLKLEDSDGISTLLTTEIFKQLPLMGYVSNSDK